MLEMSGGRQVEQWRQLASHAANTAAGSSVIGQQCRRHGTVLRNVVLSICVTGGVEHWSDQTITEQWTGIKGQAVHPRPG